MLREKFKSLVNALSADPWQPHLGLHSLKVRLNGISGVSFTYSFCITLTIQFSENEITLLDIGSHDKVYDY